MPRFRRFTLALAAISALLLPQATRDQEGKRVLKVMTRNMDAGTDLKYIFGLGIPAGVDLTMAEVQASQPDERAARLAEEIGAAQPDLIALQEVTEWRTGPCGQTTVLYDQAKLLLDELSRRDLHYEPVQTNVFAPIEAPMSETGKCARITDSDVVLGKANLERTGIHVFNAQAHQYTYLLDLAPLGIPVKIGRGYITLDVTAGSTTFRLANTHLESTYYFDPNGGLQALQAGELLAALGDTTMPVLLMGDFNSNAESSGPEQTPTVPAILAAGFHDVWREFNSPGTGFTWPLFYEEDANCPIVSQNCPAVPNERIDLIFTRGLRALKVGMTGLMAPYASDHAGVTASIQVGK